MLQKEKLKIIFFILIFVILIVFVGFVVFAQRTGLLPLGQQVSPPVTEESGKTDISTPASILDSARAEVIVDSVRNDLAEIRIVKIKQYRRYPKATYPQLQVGSLVTVRAIHVSPETSENTDQLSQMIKEGVTPTEILQPKLITGKIYLADLSYCATDYIGGLGCNYEGWSAAFYPIRPASPTLRTQIDTNIATPPPVTPQ